MEILVDCAHGIYIPQLLAERYGGELGFDKELMEALLAGPDQEESEIYWSAYEDALRGEWTDMNGDAVWLDTTESGDLCLYGEGESDEYGDEDEEDEED
jgi:hypothetical protein